MSNPTMPKFVVMREGRGWFIYGPTRMRVAGPFFDKRAALATYWREFGR